MKKLRQIASLVLCFLLLLSFFPAFRLVKAESNHNVVRVGWYDSPLNMIDKYGRRSGYAYDYQMKISSYTGWKYEYISESWQKLYQMLLDGEIDMLSDVSYTEERAEQMLFSSLPMGFEMYYACVSSLRDTDVTPEDLSSFNGKRIGVSANSFQETLLVEWLERNGLEAEVVELTGVESDSIAMLNNGEIDVFVYIDVFGDTNNLIPICAIGSSDIFFAVNPARADLMNDLNTAMARILDENRNYNQHLHEKYFNTMVVNPYFTQNEVNWLASHGAVRVGYQDDYLAFCATDKQTGELTGALKNYLALASQSMQNATVMFEAEPFDTVEDALTALKTGDIDCVFPVDLTAYDGESLGMMMTDSIMQTEVYAAVKSEKRHSFTPDGNITVALPRYHQNYLTFVLEYFPSWRRVTYTDRAESVKAVAAGEADCFLVCNYRLGRLDDELENNGLTAISTGRSMSFSFAVRTDDDILYSILNKTAHYVPETSVNTALVSYSYEKEVVTFTDFLKAHMMPVMSAAGTVLFLLLLLLIKSAVADRKAKKSLKALKESLEREEKQQHELDETKDKAYTDALTGVKSKAAYAEARDELDRAIHNGEKPEFALIVFDVNDLKRMNDVYGHEAGDRLILSAKELICDTFKRSPVYRIGGDEFLTVLSGADYKDSYSLLHSFDQQVEANLHAGKIVVSSGFARYEPEGDASYSEVFRRADELMYQRKRYLKSLRAGTNAAVQPQTTTASTAAATAAPAANNTTTGGAPSVNTATGTANDTAAGKITIEGNGIQVHAPGNIPLETLNVIIGTMQSK
ncbi:MAG: GGDEF domain-containing protein [Clostridia bacterium]|nr:GGDEF domain-containing protein [Clostridia bacterium]